MELKTLFIGIVFAMGVFAVKSGVGIHYLLARKEGVFGKCTHIGLYGLLYLLLFLLCGHIIDRIDLISHFEAFQKFLQYGMGLHVLMAGGLLIWGLLLLRRAGKSGKSNTAWLALIIPCPVCLTVIFLSLSFLISYFPDAVHLAAISAYGAFMAIVSVTVMVMALWLKHTRQTPELSLGTAMILIAVYFLLSIIILPQFGSVDEIYRLAAHEGDTRIIEADDIWAFLSIISLFLMLGFLRKKKKLKMRWKWI